MIPKQDLRIGNYVYPNGQVQIFADLRELRKDLVNFTEFIEVPYDSLEPIPLTEELLLKCGFEYGNACKMYVNDFEIEMLKRRSKDDYTYYAVLKHYTNEVEINSLHQLQNLFYALTGTELEVKL